MPWGKVEDAPPVSGIYTGMIVQAGALFPAWVAYHDGKWVNAYDYEIEYTGKINFWIGPWSPLKFDA